MTSVSPVSRCIQFYCSAKALKGRRVLISLTAASRRLPRSSSNPVALFLFPSGKAKVFLSAVVPLAATLFAVAWRALLAIRPFVSIAVPAFPLFQALRKADWTPGKVKSRAEPIFQETLITEVQRLGLIGEQHESGRSGGCLRHVVDLHLTAGGRRPPIEIDLRKPTIQLAS